MEWSLLFPLLTLVFLFGRSFPFVYHFRMLWYIVSSRFLSPPLRYPTEETYLYFRAWPDDLDWNGHMGNSSYNKLADFARYSHFARCQRTDVAGGNGGVFFRFKQSIGPFQSFRIQTRFFGSTTEKWIWMEHRFQTEFKLPSSSGRKREKIWRTVACGLCKVVIFKKKKEILKPSEFFNLLGFLPETHPNPNVPAGMAIEQCEKLFGEDEFKTVKTSKKELEPKK